jgi:hypothetical protein
MNTGSSVEAAYAFFFSFSSFSVSLAFSLRPFASARISLGVLFFAPGVRPMVLLQGIVELFKIYD